LIIFKEVQAKFEKEIKKTTNVDIMCDVSHFLGLRFQWRQTNTNLKVHLSQEAFADTLIEQTGLSHFATTNTKTPYRSGYPVEMITEDMSLTDSQRLAIQAQYRTLVGSLLWLSKGTRPDLSTITTMLAKHQHNPNDKHISSVKHAIKYLKGSKTTSGCESRTFYVHVGTDCI